MTADDETDVQQPKLRKVGRMPALHRYLAGAWRSRNFVPRQGAADPIIDGGPSMLQRVTWLALPFAEAVLWFAVLALVLDISWGEVRNPFTFILSGVLIFAYTARSIERAAGSMSRARPLTAAFDLPNVLVPLATLWRQSGSFLMTLYVLVLVVLLLPPTGAISAAWAFLPVLFVLHFLFNASAGLLTARLGHSPKQIKQFGPAVAKLAGLREAASRRLGTYSSGMAAQLRFALTTAIKPKILLVDEALNTGDEAFAERAEKALALLSANGSTIFLVSQSPAVIERVCTRAIWLDKGRVRLEGAPESVTRAYNRR